MPSRRVAAELNAGTYYLTLTVQRWYYLFDRYNRWQIMTDSIRYCQDNKGLEVNGYVFMLNHIHFIVTSPELAGFLRDFKRFTTAKFKPVRRNRFTGFRRMETMTAEDLSTIWETAVGSKTLVHEVG